MKIHIIFEELDLNGQASIERFVNTIQGCNNGPPRNLVGTKGKVGLYGDVSGLACPSVVQRFCSQNNLEAKIFGNGKDNDEFYDHAVLLMVVKFIVVFTISKNFCFEIVLRAETLYYRWTS